jgi:hypothetical protein
MREFDAEATPPSAARRVAGVLVKYDGALYFVPADVAQRIVRRPVISRVPGTELGITLVGGRVTSVVDVGERGDELLVCDVEGESVALAGLTMLGSGFYEAEGEGARLGDTYVPRFDVRAELRRVEGGLLGRGTHGGAS